MSYATKQVTVVACDFCSPDDPEALIMSEDTGEWDSDLYAGGWARILAEPYDKVETHICRLCLWKAVHGTYLKGEGNA